MSKKKTFHLYRINWTDASSNSGWKDLNELHIQPFQVASVGWLIKENKDFLFLAQNMASVHQASEIMSIPRKWIHRKTKITKHMLTYDE